MNGFNTPEAFEKGRVGKTALSCTPLGGEVLRLCLLLAWSIWPGLVGASGTYFTRIFHKMVGFYRDSCYAHGSHACWIAGSWNPTDERFCSILTFKEVCIVFP